MIRLVPTSSVQVDVQGFQDILSSEKKITLEKCKPKSLSSLIISSPIR
jgi:hypothetical protein